MLNPMEYIICHYVKKGIVDFRALCDFFFLITVIVAGNLCSRPFQ